MNRREAAEQIRQPRQRRTVHLHFPLPPRLPPRHHLTPDAGAAFHHPAHLEPILAAAQKVPIPRAPEERPIESNTAPSIQLVFPEPFSPRRSVGSPSSGANASR